MSSREKRGIEPPFLPACQTSRNNPAVRAFGLIESPREDDSVPEAVRLSDRLNPALTVVPAIVIGFDGIPKKDAGGCQKAKAPFPNVPGVLVRVEVDHHDLKLGVNPILRQQGEIKAFPVHGITPPENGDFRHVSPRSTRPDAIHRAAGQQSQAVFFSEDDRQVFLD
jgi:hypothetical protein